MSQFKPHGSQAGNEAAVRGNLTKHFEVSRPQPRLYVREQPIKHEPGGVDYRNNMPLAKTHRIGLAEQQSLPSRFDVMNKALVPPAGGQPAPPARPSPTAPNAPPPPSQGAPSPSQSSNPHGVKAAPNAPSPATPQRPSHPPAPQAAKPPTPGQQMQSASKPPPPMAGAANKPPPAPSFDLEGAANKLQSTIANTRPSAFAEHGMDPTPGFVGGGAKAQPGGTLNQPPPGAGQRPLPVPGAGAKPPTAPGKSGFGAAGAQPPSPLGSPAISPSPAAPVNFAPQASSSTKPTNTKLTAPTSAPGEGPLSLLHETEQGGDLPDLPAPPVDHGPEIQGPGAATVDPKTGMQYGEGGAPKPHVPGAQPPRMAQVAQQGLASGASFGQDLASPSVGPMVGRMTGAPQRAAGAVAQYQERAANQKQSQDKAVQAHAKEMAAQQASQDAATAIKGGFSIFQEGEDVSKSMAIKAIGFYGDMEKEIWRFQDTPYYADALELCARYHRCCADLAKIPYDFDEDATDATRKGRKGHMKKQNQIQSDWMDLEASMYEWKAKQERQKQNVTKKGLTSNRQSVRAQRASTKKKKSFEGNFSVDGDDEDTAEIEKKFGNWAAPMAVGDAELSDGPDVEKKFGNWAAPMAVGDAELSDGPEIEKNHDEDDEVMGELDKCDKALSALLKGSKGDPYDYFTTIGGKKVAMDGEHGSGTSQTPMPAHVREKIDKDKAAAQSKRESAASVQKKTKKQKKADRKKAKKQGKKSKQSAPAASYSLESKTRSRHEVHSGGQHVGTITTRFPKRAGDDPAHHHVTVNGEKHKFPGGKEGLQAASNFLQGAHGKGHEIKKSGWGAALRQLRGYGVDLDSSMFPQDGVDAVSVVELINMIDDSHPFGRVSVVKKSDAMLALKNRRVRLRPSVEDDLDKALAWLGSTSSKQKSQIDR